MEPLPVVPGELLVAPAPSGIHGLHGVDRAHHLVVESPAGVALFQARKLPHGSEPTGDDEVEVLVEVGLHLLHPLRDKTGRSDDERSLHQSANLELTQYQTRFDGLPQPHFVREEEADSVSRHRPGQSVDLMGKRKEGPLQWGYERIPLERVRNAPRGRCVDDVMTETPCVLLAEGREPLAFDAHHHILSRNPDAIRRGAPQPLPVNDLARLTRLRQPDPLSNRKGLVAHRPLAVNPSQAAWKRCRSTSGGRHLPAAPTPESSSRPPRSPGSPSRSTPR